jgi:AcrR family transcriptional regulator
MALTIDTRRSRWGSAIPTAVVRDFIRTGIRHSAIADFVNEYVFDALASGEPPELADALRMAFDEIVEASRPEDWERVASDLLADARDCLADPPEPPVLPGATTAGGQAVRRRRRYAPHGPKARGRRDTADRLIDALEELCREHPDIKPRTLEVARRANLAKETVYQQFGRTAGLIYAAEARAAIRLPALWADLGLRANETLAEQIKATAREYVRLALAHPGPTRALLFPEAIHPLIAPKPLERYRTLQEMVATLTSRANDQDRLLTDAITSATGRGSLRAIDPPRAVEQLNSAWLPIATLAWQPVQLRPDDRDLHRQIAASTEGILSDLLGAGNAFGRCGPPDWRSREQASTITARHGLTEW